MYLHPSRLKPVQLHITINMNGMLVVVACWALHPVDLSSTIKLKLTEFPFFESI